MSICTSVSTLGLKYSRLVEQGLVKSICHGDHLCLSPVHLKNKLSCLASLLLM